MLPLLLALVFLHPAMAKSPAPKSAPMSQGKKEALERLTTICVKNSYTDGKDQGSACDCLRANYERKLSVAELELLGRIQTGTASKEEIQGQDELFEFDMLASHHCLEDSAWRWQPDEASKKAEPEKKPAAKAEPKSPKRKGNQ